MNAIFICSVHHTGSWFAIDALRNHPDSGPFFELKDLLSGTADKDAVNSERTHVIHTHYVGRGIQAGYHVDGEGTWAKLKAIMCQAMMQECKTIIPIRDPAMAIITRASRHPDKDPVWVPLAFEELFALRDLPNVHFLPVDLDWSNEKRLLELKAVMSHVGFDPDSPFVDEYAARWAAPKYNISNDTPIKKGYRDRNPESLMHLQTIFPKAINELYGRRAQLIPILEAMGYRDLLWWE